MATQRTFITTAKAMLALALLTVFIGRTPIEQAQAQDSAPATYQPVDGGYIVIGHLDRGARFEVTGQNGTTQTSIDSHLSEMGQGGYCAANASFYDLSTGNSSLPVINDGVVTQGFESLNDFNVRGLYMSGNAAWVSDTIDLGFDGDLMVGLVPEPVQSDGRGTTLAAAENNNIYIYVTTLPVMEAVAKLVNEYGVQEKNIVHLDGGGSSQLYCRDGGSLVTSSRQVPFGIGIVDSGIKEFWVIYSHLDSLPVPPGTWVEAGQQIGIAGYSGYMDWKDPENTHVHLAISKNPPWWEGPLMWAKKSHNSDWIAPKWLFDLLGISLPPGIQICGVGFGKENDAGNQSFHNAEDLCGWKYQEPVNALFSCEVVYADHFPKEAESLDSGHGKVEIQHCLLKEPIFPESVTAEVINDYETQEGLFVLTDMGPQGSIEWNFGGEAQPQPAPKPSGTKFPVSTIAFLSSGIVLLLMILPVSRGWRWLYSIAFLVLIGTGFLTLFLGTTRAEGSELVPPETTNKQMNLTFYVPPEVVDQAMQATLDPNVPLADYQTVSPACKPEVAQWNHLFSANADDLITANVLCAVVRYEDPRGDPKARSSCDATGLMQVMPSDGDRQKFIKCGGIVFRKSVDQNGNPITIEVNVFAKRPTIAELEVPEFNVAYGKGMLRRATDKGLSKGLDYRSALREALFGYGPSDVGYVYADTILNCIDLLANNQSCPDYPNP